MEIERTYYTLEEMLGLPGSGLGAIVGAVQSAIELAKNKPDIRQHIDAFLEAWRQSAAPEGFMGRAQAQWRMAGRIRQETGFWDVHPAPGAFPRKDDSLAERRRPERRAGGGFGNDRVFPLETVEIQTYRQRHSADLEQVTIHTGRYADGFARSWNALAVAVAGDVFFRDGAYNPATEEGRRTLAHELTHVAQHEGGRITANTEAAELEAEAEAAERGEGPSGDGWITFEAGGELFRIRESEYGAVVREAADMVEEMVREKKHTLGEEEYLRFLLAYKGWLEETR